MLSWLIFFFVYHFIIYINMYSAVYAIYKHGLHSCDKLNPNVRTNRP